MSKFDIGLLGLLIGFVVGVGIVAVAYIRPPCYEGYVMISRYDGQAAVVGDVEFCGEFGPVIGPSNLYPGRQSR